jgi:MoaA/NifB/PqqE/SkfB family radical SAM enzyme
MERLKGREHDFGSKLRQASVVERLRDYVLWQRNLDRNPNQGPPRVAPVSINLDLTSACNFSCPFCVDSGIINRGTSLSFKEVERTLDLLREKGLLSVILIGGGEPTLHKDFEAIVRELKRKRLQVGIATNGTKLEKVAAVAEILEKKDWVRLSIDAGTEETFRALHRPRVKITLEKMLKQAKEVKGINPSVSFGYSFVIVWEGLEIQGKKLAPNITEMAEAVRLAKRYAFDYVSFKPCLIRLETSQRESLLDQVSREEEEKIRQTMRMNLEKAKKVAGGEIKVLESVNLMAILDRRTESIKRQPKRCHMQFFRTVVSPLGIFHCPAFRGVEKGRVAGSDGYLSEVKFDESLGSTGASIVSFDAEAECREVGCFYHSTNWWLDDLIHSEKDVDGITTVEDENFFL